MKVLWAFVVVQFVLRRWVDGFDDLNVTELFSYVGVARPLMVPLSLIPGAAAKGAVCLDGTLPAYHLHRGFGSGANSWLIQLEGGGWCNNIRTCLYRKTTRRGSSNYMEKQIPFTGILSNKPEENPDFFNWNRVKLRYCDGASFAGEGQDKAAKLFFRGQRIWLAAMEELMSKGMHYANQALLSGCSAGGLASILHCDEFRELFPKNTKVKCLGDAGLFLDALDVSGGRTLRALFWGVVNFQGARKNLPRTCTNHMDPTSCFFPQNLVANIRTPLFLLNAAYDTWQIQASLAPPSVDPHGYWHACKMNYRACNPSQIQFFQGFRNEMLNSVRGFSVSRQNGLFINSCFAHCQSERQDTWFGNNSPLIGNKGIARSVGDWYFERSTAKAIDCPYPCDRTCHNLVEENDGKCQTKAKVEPPTKFQAHPFQPLRREAEASATACAHTLSRALTSLGSSPGLEILQLAMGEFPPLSVSIVLVEPEILLGKSKVHSRWRSSPSSLQALISPISMQMLLLPPLGLAITTHSLSPLGFSSSIEDFSFLISQALSNHLSLNIILLLLLLLSLQLLFSLPYSFLFSDPSWTLRLGDAGSDNQPVSRSESSNPTDTSLPSDSSPSASTSDTSSTDKRDMLKIMSPVTSSQMDSLLLLVQMDNMDMLW